MNTNNNGDGPAAWLLLAAGLPGREAGSARVKLWRTLKDIGAVALRDGVSVVPASGDMRQRLAAIVKEIETGGGSAWVFVLPQQDASVERKLRAMFDRSDAYRVLSPALAALRNGLVASDEANARRRYRELEREFQAVATLDFFPGAAHARLSTGLEKLRAAIDRRFSPAEPASTPGRVARRNPRRFSGAVWATRKRLWVDRVASAWLIKRFIDERARFIWLDSPADCPAEAHGFDFDGATFTHVGELVTFEVLVGAFDLDDDAGLAGLGRLVHYLDIGGDVVAEAAGFEAVLNGLRDSCGNDDALLAATTPVLDALYQHFTSTPA
jgi:hypothetical protein